MTDSTLFQPDAALTEVRALLGEISQAIFTLTRSAADPVIEAIDPERRGAVFMLMNAAGREPEALTVADLNRRTPYTTIETQSQPLAHAASKGYLVESPPGEYRMTAEGKAALQRLVSAFYQRLGELEAALAPAISIDDLAHTANDLRRLADACRTTSIDTWGAQMSHGLAPKKPAAALAHIDQAIDDLNAFRDDAHIAAWQPYGISANAWELFTFLWRGEVKNAAEFAEKAERRGHSLAVHQAALAELIDRGWVQAADDEAYALTSAGRAVRESAEAETERNYYSPWAVFDQKQLADLRDRLTQLKAGLAQLAEPVPA